MTEVDFGPNPGGPLDTPLNHVCIEVFNGTPWEAQAQAAVFGGPEAQPETLHGVVLAGANLYHAAVMMQEPWRIPERSALLGILAGHTVEQIMDDARANGFKKTSIGQIVAQRSALTATIGNFIRAQEGAAVATLPELIRAMQGESSRQMSGVTYDSRHLHIAVSLLGRESSGYASDSGRVAANVKALLHHFSDSSAAPPSVLTSSQLTESLSDLRDRYRQWVERAGIPVGDASYQLMNELLALDDGRPPQSFAQILGREPRKTSELSRQLSEHMQAFFLEAAQLPPVRQKNILPAFSPRAIGAALLGAEDAAATASRPSVAPLGNFALPHAVSDDIRAYLKVIGRIPLINAETEVSLAKRIEAGLYAAHRLEAVEDAGEELPFLTRDLLFIVRDGEHAKTHFIEGNLRLVVSLAKRYTGRGVAFLDLIQSGNLGLIRAVEKFDYTKGYKFSTYATGWIREALSRAVADQARTIRVPVEVVDQINKMAGVESDLRADLGRHPTEAEVAKALGVTPDIVRKLKQYNRTPLSLDRTIDEDNSARFGDLIGDADAVDALDIVAFGLLKEKLEGILSTLSDREAGIVRLRFGLTDGHTHNLEEIGQAYGISLKHVHQILATAMRRLRRRTAPHLRDYLD